MLKRAYLPYDLDVILRLLMRRLSCLTEDESSILAYNHILIQHCIRTLRPDLSERMRV